MNIKEVDIVGFDEKNGLVCLVAIDNLSWHDVDGHLGFLQEKILSYVSFIEDGELKKRFPSKANYTVEIKVVFEHQPPEAGDRFIKQAMLILRDTGYNLSFCTYNEDA